MKCDEHIKIHIPGQTKDRLRDLAKKNDRELSDYVRHVLTRHVIVAAALEGEEGAKRPN
ncbi:MAG TPA: hypothetical protein VFU31_24850 [Candidatus Binatia bacterium]|nr:hypothetical protein [Candidatus Binatia bacterium]